VGGGKEGSWINSTGEKKIKNNTRMNTKTENKVGEGQRDEKGKGRGRYGGERTQMLSNPVRGINQAVPLDSQPGRNGTENGRNMTAKSILNANTHGECEKCLS